MHVLTTPFTLAALVLVLLAGCQTNSQLTPPPAPQPVPPERLYPLLDAAKLAYDEDRLTAASGDAALGLYRQVLKLDPKNAEALRGIESIVERFVELALIAAEEWRLASARSMLARARIIDADHPSIAPTQAQIELLTKANREEVYFDHNNLRTANNRQTLTRLGRRSKTFDCRARIRAHNDAAGRWIYQQMNAAPGDVRVRATMEVGVPARVALVCF